MVTSNDHEVKVRKQLWSWLKEKKTTLTSNSSLPF